LPRSFGRLDARDEPFWALLWIAVTVTVCELLAGFSPTAARALNLVLDASSVFLGLLFAGSALACIRLFYRDPARRLTAVIVPAAGTLALLGILGATIGGGDSVLRGCACAGIVLGVPFAWLVKNGRRTPRPQ
jgi:amino acid transporter